MRSNTINRVLETEDLLKYILVLSIFIKSIILYIMEAKLFRDGHAYVSIAEYIYNNNLLFPNNVMDAPVTPYFYSLFYFLYDYMGASALAIGNIILATATIFLMYKIAIEIFDNIKIANIVSMIALLYPFFNFYTITILTETIYIFFLYLSMLYAIKFYKTNNLKYLALFVLFFTIDTLTRFANLGMYPFFLLLFIFFAYKNNKGLKYISKMIFVFVFVFLSIMSSWWIRNYYVYDKFIMTSVGYSGIAFYSGNNPINKSGGGIGGVDMDLSIFEHIKDSELKDKAQWDYSLKWIKENPMDYPVLEFRKFQRFFSLTFYTPLYDIWYYNLLSIVSYGSILLLFIYTLLFKMKPYLYLISPMLLYSILLTGVHMVFIASIRYRLPIEPFMIIVASYGLYVILIKLKLIKNELND